MNYHPEGDVVFGHVPLINVSPGNSVPVEISLSGEANVIEAYLDYREGDSGDFTEVVMGGSGGNFSGEIPDFSGAQFQYYFRTVDDNGAQAFYPLGGEIHPYSVIPGSNTLEDSFENGLLYWKSGGTNNMWGLTAIDAVTGNVSISDSPTLNYFDNTDSWLESTFSLDLSGGASTMSFHFMGHLQADRDSLFIEASVNNGASWSRVGDGISGSQTNFIQYDVSLNDYGGQPDVKVRFHLVTDGSGRRDGMLIDDVSISWNPTGVEDDDFPVPGQLSLSQNYPNPFNPSTSISFSIREKGEVNLTVFDLLGREVNTIASGVFVPGNHTVEWTGTDSRGRDVASGIYLYRIQFGDVEKVRMMTLLR